MAQTWQISSRGTKMGVNADRKQYARLQRVFRQVHSVSHFHNENWTPILIGDGQWNAFVNGGIMFCALGTDERYCRTMPKLPQ